MNQRILIALFFTLLTVRVVAQTARPTAQEALSTLGPGGSFEKIRYLQDPLDQLPQKIAHLESQLEKSSTAPTGYDNDNRRGCLKLALTGLKSLRAGDPSGAETFLSQARLLECTSEDIVFYLAWSIANQSRYHEVIDLIGKNEKICASDAYLKPYCESILGRSYFLTGEYRSSVRYLSSVATQYPGDLPHRYFWGLALLETGAKDEGAAKLTEVLDLVDATPGSEKIAVRICEALGQYYFLERNNPERARVYVVEGLKRAPKHAKLRDLLKQLDGRRASP